MGKFVANRADGSTINFANPQYESFNASLTFRAMSFINRWAGNITREYSVLQHSMLVAELIMQPELKIYGLLHDVPEDGTGDITGPYKDFLDKMCNGFVHAHEQQMFNQVCISAGIEPPSDRVRKVIHRADMEARATELRDVVANPVGIKIAYDPSPKRIPVVPREQLIAQALDRYYTYMSLHHMQLAEPAQ